MIYTHSKAQTLPTLIRLPNTVGDGKKAAAAKAIEFLASYTKPFEGPAWRGRKVHKRVRFYDEREWRYVPIVPAGQSLFLERKDFDNAPKKNALHSCFLKYHALPIHSDDVQYLIVPYNKDEHNVLELHDYVMKLYAQRGSRKDAILVATAIMTEDRIHKDV